jgi:putative ubiquitin-RnfH superfamily antitoxin RatB of RatAB toxin-antitoxin module
LRVEVAFALPEAQNIVVLELTEGAVAGEAVAASGMLARHGLDAARLNLGVSGVRVSPEQRLREGDRVEILRPLAADPNEARRARARRARR